MVTELVLGDVSVDVVRKDIKNLHLSVYPPTGRVRIAAPSKTSLEAIRAFAISRLMWIKKHQRKQVQQEREPSRVYVDRESHYVWGERVLLKVEEVEAPPTVVRRHKALNLRIRPGTETAGRSEVIEAWYREQLRKAAEPLLAKWQTRLGVRANALFVQRMRTKWGSCNPASGNIRLNTELAKKPPECLDYLVLHELAHLKVRLHTPQFFDLLDHSMPHWRAVRQRLNDLPLREQ